MKVRMICISTNFYPRSPCGERRPRQIIVIVVNNFYPRSPCGERQDNVSTPDRPKEFLSTLSLRRATIRRAVWAYYQEFLSTLSLRRATSIKPILSKINTNFYPRSPCGERRWLRCWQLAARDISIHALLAESDTRPIPAVTRVANFYPRSPCGERPLFGELCGLIIKHFYPRSPCGERRHRLTHHQLKYRFLSTLSLRRATTDTTGAETAHENFYPRSPCGERH